MEMVSQGLLQRGHDVSVALMGPSVQRSWERRLPNLVVGPLPATWSAARDHPAASLAFLRRLLGTQRPDVVVVTEPGGALLVRTALVASRGPRPRIVSWAHGDIGRMSYFRSMRLCDGHLAISRGIADQMAQWRRRGAPVSVVYNPIAEPAGLCDRPPAGAPAAFVFVGRLERQKRFDRLLRILAGVEPPNWRLDVVGDGALRGEMTDLAAQLGLADRIGWHGWLPEPWRAVQRATAFLMTSDTEGFPLVLLEAIARGVPLVAMDCAFGPAEIVQPGTNGWLVPMGAEDRFTQVLGGICDGALPLPPADVVRLTAAPYRLDAVLTAFEAALSAVVAPQRH